jgi:hypothetical protein
MCSNSHSSSPSPSPSPSADGFCQRRRRFYARTRLTETQNVVRRCGTQLLFSLQRTLDIFQRLPAQILVDLVDARVAVDRILDLIPPPSCSCSHSQTGRRTPPQTLYTHHAQRLNNQFVLLRTEHTSYGSRRSSPRRPACTRLSPCFYPPFVFFTYPLS